MKISMSEARQRLGKVGIELGRVLSGSNGGDLQASYRITTPVGSTVSVRARDVVALLRDLDRFSIQA